MTPQQIAAQVVRHMPGTWRLDQLTPPDWREAVEIFNADDWHHKGRLSIYGLKAAYKKQGKITVDPKRPPAQIAQEIARRCLPEYRAGLAELRATEASMKAAADAKAARLACLKAVCPTIEEARDYHRGGTMYTFKGGMVRENGYDSRVHVELNLAFDDTVRLLAFLAAHDRPGA